jgi:hypothetical protein
LVMSTRMSMLMCWVSMPIYAGDGKSVMVIKMLSSADCVPCHI